MVLLHAQALLTSSPQGAVDYIDADLRDPQAILAAAAKTLDLFRPVAVMLIAITAPDRGRRRPLPAGERADGGGTSREYLALSQVASDIEAEQMAEAAKRYNRMAAETQRHRSDAEVERFFDGLELQEPGVVAVQQWRPGSDLRLGPGRPCGASGPQTLSVSRPRARGGWRPASRDDIETTILLLVIGVAVTELAVWAGASTRTRAGAPGISTGSAAPRRRWPRATRLRC